MARHSRILLLVALVGIIGCGGDSGGGPVTPPVTVSVTLAPGTVDLEVGRTAQLTASVQNARQDVQFSSSNNTIATVSASGMVTALAAGSAVITATSAADANARATAAVSVRNPVTVAVSPPTGSIAIAQSLQLNAAVTGGTSTAVTWSTSAAGVAVVAPTGIVTGVSAGTAVITATSVADPSKAASAVITVLQPVAVTMTPGPTTLPVGLTGRFQASVTGTDNTAVTWLSSAPGVATIDATGAVLAVSVGTTTINATSVADPSRNATATLTVTPPIAITITSGPAALILGQTAQYTATVTGSSNTALTWASTVPTVATIDNTGFVTTVAPGTTSISARSVADPTKVSTVSLFVGAPDLVVDAFVAPATAVTGATLNGVATVRNLGNAPAAAFQVGFYYSTDNVFSTDDVYSGTGCTLAAGLAAAAATECSGTVAVPASLALGAYYLLVVADNTAQVKESNENNNAGASTATVQITGVQLPDLSVDAVTAAATGIPGGTVNITSTVRNTGAAITASFRVAFYYSVDATITTADVFSGSGCTSVTGLAGNTTSDCNGAINIPASIAPGTYYVGAIVDDNALIVEANETNNARAAATTTTIAGITVGPDLVVETMTAPATGPIGGNITVSSLVRNLGTATTTSFRLGFYYSLDATITKDDFSTGFGCTYASGLGANASSTCSGAIPVAATLAPGVYYVGAIADVNSVIAETNETNNSRAAANTTVMGIPPVVITVTPATATIAVGQTQQLTATVTGATNTGVTFISSAPGVATVSSTGLVNAVGTGVATITASALAEPAKTFAVTITVTPGGGPFNMLLTKAYVTQSVQTNAGDIQLVAGKAGLLRAFVTANVANTARPVVRARIYFGTQLQSTTSIAATPLTVPFSTVEGPLTGTWNLALSAAQIQTGLRIVLDLDPDNLIVEASDGDNTLEITPQVVTLPTFAARLIPILQSPNSLTGDVTTANRDGYMTVASTMHPIGAYNVDVRNVYTTTNAIGEEYTVGWSAVLSEINVLRISEDPSRYYYGVLKPPYSFGGTGVGYLGTRAAIGVDFSNLRAQTMAHEWGHNFNRSHAPCGDPGGPDPLYPYAGGTIGTWGYDALNNRDKPPEYTDLMGYCDRATQWVSDYTYRGVLTWRQQTQAGAPASAVAENSLIVWGRITRDGIVLEPAFQAVTQPSMPEGRGPALLQGFDNDGNTLFSYAMSGAEVADGPEGERHFAYAIPMRLVTPDRLKRLRVASGFAAAQQTSTVLAPQPLSAALMAETMSSASAVRAGSKVNVRWDSNVFPLVVVRDGVTGEILSLARGGAVSVLTASANVVLQVSDGVHSQAFPMPVR